MPIHRKLIEWVTVHLYKSITQRSEEEGQKGAREEKEDKERDLHELK